MTEKIKKNFNSYTVTFVLFALSVACVIAKAIVGSSIDADGMLKEPFFLLPLALILFVSGMVLLFVTVIKNILILRKNADIQYKKELKRHILAGIGLIVLCTTVIFLLILANK
ncbi:MAG: DUF3955 domain-containing protein [Erysipelotrichia bacterium]|nr:DUF3955 domain-containing protein [Erysipelotrichia bacterium]